MTSVTAKDVNKLKLPHECASKEEVRNEIDNIDQEIIQLFAQRFKYVQQIVKFKNDVESVIAQERKDHVIEQRGKWAADAGLDTETFEEIYRLLIDHNIQKEIEILTKGK